MKATDAPVELSLEIRADRDTVFRVMCDPATFPQWMGPGSEIEPRVGGDVRVPFANGIVASGRVVELGNYRLAFSWGYGNEDASSTLVRLSLHACEGGTLLVLTHEGLESERDRSGHLAGWRHYTAVLANACLAERSALIEHAVDRWIEAWNTSSAAARAELLEACYAEDGLFRDRGALVEERQEVAAYIDGARRFLPDARAERTSDIERCHEYLRYAVRISDGSGGIMQSGWHFAEIGVEGRLKRVVAFWEEA